MWRMIFGVESYAIVQAAVVILFATLAVVLFRRSRIRLWHAAALTLLYVLCNFLVAKTLFDYVKDGGQRTFFNRPFLAHFLDGGYWGWPIAFLPCAFVYPFVFGLPRVAFLRAVAFILPPVFALQKVACFLAGCCFGCETSLPWAVVFPEGSLCETPGVPIHPLQIYDGLLPLVALGILVLVDHKGGEVARPFLFPLLIALYALARFATEFLRFVRPEESKGLLQSQWVELAALFAVMLLLILGRGPWRRLLHAQASVEPTDEKAGAMLTTT